MAEGDKGFWQGAWEAVVEAYHMVMDTGAAVWDALIEQLGGSGDADSHDHGHDGGAGDAGPD